jgi:hypothetical protein
MRRITLLALVFVFGCGGNKVATSQPVGINLSASSSAAKNGTLDVEKDITTESGNPYGVFVGVARQNSGGKDPSQIMVSSLAVLLGAGSQGVTSLDQVFAAGEVDVLFAMDSTNNSYPVGTLTNVTGPGPVSANITFDPTSVSAADQSALLSGSFKVVIRGPAAAGFVSGSDKANLQANFTFEAFE